MANRSTAKATNSLPSNRGGLLHDTFCNAFMAFSSSPSACTQDCIIVCPLSTGKSIPALQSTSLYTTCRIILFFTVMKYIYCERNTTPQIRSTWLFPRIQLCFRINNSMTLLLVKWPRNLLTFTGAIICITASSTIQH